MRSIARARYRSKRSSSCRPPNPLPGPRWIQREWQYVDLFPGWIDGLTRLAAMLRHEVARRAALRA